VSCNLPVSYRGNVVSYPSKTTGKLKGNYR